MTGPRHEYPYETPGATHEAGYVTAPVLAVLRERSDVRRVLDLGCGNGNFAAQLLAAGYDVTGCDPSESGIAVARESVPRARFEVAGVYDDPGRLGRAEFDAVVAMEVIEHLYLPRALPAFARVVLKRRGVLVVTTPYHGYLKNLAISIRGGWDAHFSPLWDGGHVKFFSPRTLQELMSTAGFELEEFRGAGRVPWLWKSMVLVFRRTES